MSACALPGCISDAVHGGILCVVHQSEHGRLCEQCQGRGYRYYTEGEFLCDRCAGVGLVDYKKPTPRAKKQADPVDQRGLIVQAKE